MFEYLLYIAGALLVAYSVYIDKKDNAKGINLPEKTTDESEESAQLASMRISYMGIFSKNHDDY